MLEYFARNRNDTVVIDDERYLALFDFDGTLLPCDSQVLFFDFVARRKPGRRLLLILFLTALPLGLFGKWGERQLKRLFLVYLWGMRKEEVESLADEFVALVIMPLLFPEVVAMLREHQGNGDYCVLVTASPSVYANAIGRALEFDLTLATDVEYGDCMPFFPRLAPPNNKGGEKVARLCRLGLLPEEGARAYSRSYSDSMADLPMLLKTESQILVNPKPELKRALYDKTDVTVLTPPKLWSSAWGKARFLLGKLLGFGD